MKDPFVPRTNRSAITQEPDTQGKWSALYPEMMGFGNQGGGSVPEGFAWPTNPKQRQEELTDQALRNPHVPQLPKGT
jgi:hypothetical protein